MRKYKDYYVGLDIGTNSVGWAATDEEYNLMKFNGKDMWGARLFDEGKKADERRMHRANRRRIARKRKRVELLQDLFAEEIEKVDPEFFLRLNESKFYPDEKKVAGRFALFFDDKYTDKEYFSKYPTIFHLRSDLIHDTNKKDIRLVYLALHNIVKHRGNFLHGGGEFKKEEGFTSLYNRLSEYLKGRFQIDFSLEARDSVEEVLSNEEFNITEKKKALHKIFSTKDRTFKAILDTLTGAKVELTKIFGEMELEEKKKVEFKNSNYDDKREELEEILNEDIELLDLLKSVYDWSILRNLIGEEKFISDAFLNTYKEHKEDLRNLKYLIKRYGDKETYSEAFRSKSIKANYPSYVNSTLFSNQKQRRIKPCSQEEVNKYFKAIIKEYSVESQDQDIYEYILNRLDLNIALPKLRTENNGVIPYQLNWSEAKAILNNASRHYDFLNKSDNGVTTKEKVLKIISFRIPYYVGPLNDYHGEENGGEGNAWIVKRKDKQILPWNFNEIVDVEASAERFIRRMTNKCTYLLGKDVIPEESLLYSEFKLLNELNNVTVNGVPIDTKTKKKIIRDLFKNKTNVKQSHLRDFLKSEGMLDADKAEIRGLDGDFKSSLSTYIKYKNIFGEKIEFTPFREIVEDLIRWKCLYGEDKDIFIKKVKREHGDILSEAEIKRVANIKHSGWGRFSEEFLTEVPGEDKDTGEMYENIISFMRENSLNLMKALSQRYSFLDSISKYNEEQEEPLSTISYDNIFKDSMLSPGVKRSVWQSILICEEIKKITNKAPKRIFLEMTRSVGEKGKRTSSRKMQLQELYENCKQDVSKIKSQLDEESDNRLRIKKLYHYYLQQGKCLYTGEAIDLSLLLANNSKWDLDHIYPRSLTKDDSVDNIVLVKKEANVKKGAKFPISEDIQKNMLSRWWALKEAGLISKEKFSRLTRKTPLSVDELYGFISRQQVETGQANKAMADILKKIYPKTRIVYVKARRISELRQHLKKYKSRDLNNFHHAHDAYLAIVVGNAYTAKFTDNPRNWLKENYDATNQYPGYDLGRFFESKIKQGKREVWSERVAQKVKKNLDKLTVLITRRVYEQQGELFDIQAKKKTVKDHEIPLKANDERLRNTSRYGGYGSVKGAYFFVVEHTIKNKRRISVQPVYLMYANKINSDKDLKEYSVDILGLENPIILVRKLRFKSKIEVDGYPLILASRGGSRLFVYDARDLVLNAKNSEVFRQVNNWVNNFYSLSKGQDEESLKNNLRNLRLEKEDLLNLYAEFCSIFKKQASEGRPGLGGEIVLKGQEKFKELKLEDMCLLISEIGKLFSSLATRGVDLSLIGGSKQSGVMRISMYIEKKNVSVFHESITGLYSHKEEVK